MRAHVVDREKARDGGAGHRQRLEHQHGVEPRQAGAALVLGQVHRGEAEVGGLAQHRARHGSGGLPGFGVRRDAGRAEVARRVEDRLLLVAEREIHPALPPPTGVTRCYASQVTVM